MRLLDFWRDLPRWARISFWTSIVIGFVCLAAGLYLDTNGFWNRWSYGSNMFTSLTSAFFGVPFAGILVTWFTTSLESRASIAAAKSSAKALSVSTWTEFKELGENHLRIVEPTVLRESAPHVTAAMERVKEIVKPVLNANWLALSQPDESQFQWAKNADDGQVAEDLRAVTRAIQEASEHFSALALSPDRIAAMNQEWAALRRRWEFLSTTVRAQRLAAGLGWGMPEGADSTFAYRFTTDVSPLNWLLVTLYKKLIHTGIAIALAEQKESASPFAVAQQLNEASWNYFDPKSITAAARRAADTLEQLLSAIKEVEAAGWPESHALAD